MQKVLGVIGGSGLYQLEALSDLKETPIETPYGMPSTAPMVGTFGKTKVVFLPRHGKGHTLLPGEINYRANICALKMLGVTNILSISAVGSMKEEIPPGDMVIVDQYIDRTRGRVSSFFGDGVVGHVSFGDPVCKKMISHLNRACEGANIRFHKGGAYICIEGPRFSSRAESNIYRGWGASVIGMTNMPEAILAREAEICYGSLAMSTDYDCWHVGHEEVNAQAVMQTFAKNIATAKKVLIELLKTADFTDCSCHEALKFALVTDKKLIPEATKKRTKPIFGKLLD